MNLFFKICLILLVCFFLGLLILYVTTLFSTEKVREIPIIIEQEPDKLISSFYYSKYLNREGVNNGDKYYLSREGKRRLLADWY
ncbi:MAG: hypothetical protein FH762_02890 [Firmicutes bacterium]|nr:hypothetical protein [Bacillota bacterium]